MIEGKISVENFLNPKIKERASGELPLYTRVRFNKRQTEFKSFSFLFDEKDEFDKNFSPSSLAKAKKKVKNPFDREVIVLTEIVDLYRKRDVNVLDINPKLIFQKSLMPVHDIVSVYAKFKMKEGLWNKYPLTIIDWTCFFPILFEGLRDIAGEINLRKDLNDYEPYYNLLVALKDFPSLRSYDGFRGYQWEYGSEGKEKLISHLKAKKVYDSHLLESMFHYYNSTISSEFTEDTKR